MRMKFKWGFATVGWSSPGHVLWVEHYMSDREVMHFRPALEQWLNDKGWTADVSFQPCEPQPSDNIKPRGSLTIAAQGLLSWDVHDLGDAMDRLAADAHREVESQIALEQPLADEFQEALRARIHRR